MNYWTNEKEAQKAQFGPVATIVFFGTVFGMTGVVAARDIDWNAATMALMFGFMMFARVLSVYVGWQYHVWRFKRKSPQPPTSREGSR